MNMTKRSARAGRSTTLEVDVCAIGAGSGGLAIARFATSERLSCVLIERAAMGGDCLNGGCVPSKALLAAAHAAAAARRTREFGVPVSIGRISSRGVYRHVRDTIEAIAPDDSQERYENYGATVIREPATFLSAGELAAGPFRVRARWFFIAAGAKAVIPSITGIDDVPYLTNETVFGLKRLPRHLVIVGAGPLGVEMAQAHRRLGARVTLLEQFAMLQGEDRELVEQLRQRLEADGVDLREGIEVRRLSAAGSRIKVVIASGGKSHVIHGSDLLLAAGRKPELASLSLESAGVEYTDRGITVDKHLRTSNPGIYAVGDVVGGTQLAHLAVHHAAVAFTNAIYDAKTEVDSGAIPRVLYTEPELAQVGLTEAETRQVYGNIRVLRMTYDHNDRAVAERTRWGMAKVVVDEDGRILGAGIVGPHAGEVIQKWTLAISAGLNVQAIASMIAPYPTIGYSDRKLAESLEGPAPLAKYRREAARAHTSPAVAEAL
jgi:pyruvate/2-oxoglutarate dehydrogenase complex dihydrolipoamide dehydrogenase (E3) component